MKTSKPSHPHRARGRRPKSKGAGRDTIATTPNFLDKWCDSKKHPTWSIQDAAMLLLALEPCGVSFPVHLSLEQQRQYEDIIAAARTDLGRRLATKWESMSSAIPAKRASAPYVMVLPGDWISWARAHLHKVLQVPPELLDRTRNHPRTPIIPKELCAEGGARPDFYKAFQRVLNGIARDILDSRKRLTAGSLRDWFEKKGYDGSGKVLETDEDCDNVYINTELKPYRIFWTDRAGEDRDLSSRSLERGYFERATKAYHQ